MEEVEDIEEGTKEGIKVEEVAIKTFSRINNINSINSRTISLSINLSSSIKTRTSKVKEEGGAQALMGAAIITEDSTKDRTIEVDIEEGIKQGVTFKEATEEVTKEMHREAEEEVMVEAEGVLEDPRIAACKTSLRISLSQLFKELEVALEVSLVEVVEALRTKEVVSVSISNNNQAGSFQFSRLKHLLIQDYNSSIRLSPWEIKD